jgi:hypothetical protein
MTMQARNDGGDSFYPPDPLPEDIVEIAAKYAAYGAHVKPNTCVADIQILLRYIEVLEDRIDGTTTT